jgi:peptidoglycan/LPS O-acetylase OafA/YrhL
VSSTLAARGQPSVTKVIPGEPPEDLRKRGPRPGFRPDIEGLRAVAILLVVLYHVGVSTFTGGYVGVDVFFVISGFIITSHLVREVTATGELSIGRFYARRAMRLLPAATLVIASTLVASWYWLPVTRLHGITRDALSASGYVINYRLALLGTDYRTATQAPSPLQHFWSLAVEEQFYAFWPLLLLVTMVLLRKRSAFTASVAVITAASLAWSIRYTGQSAVWAYFGAPTRVWELGAGALTAMAVVSLRRMPKLLSIALRWLGVAAILYSAYRFDESTPFPGYHAMLPVAGAIAVIAAGCHNPGVMLGLSGMRAIGARSYSWYLWHWPVLMIAPYVVVREYGVLQKAIAVAVALFIASLSYHYVERPLRDQPILRMQPLLAGLTGVLLTATVVAIALLLPYLPARQAMGAAVGNVSLGGQGSARTEALARKLDAAADVKILPRNLTPSLRKAAKDDPGIYTDGCHLLFDDLTTPRHCENFGVASSKTLMVLFGDSHAAQWFPALNSIAKKRHWRLAVFTKGACNAAAVKIYLPPVKRAYNECVTWRNRSLARIHALHPAVIVTSSNADGGNALDSSNQVYSDQAQVWTDGWTTTTQRLTQAGTRVIYLNDTPWPKTNVPDCVAEHTQNVETCAQTTKYAAKPDRRTSMAKAAAKAGATVINPQPWFCAKKICPVVVGNILVYKDESHISTVYAKLVAPLLAEQIRAPKRS